MCCRRRVAEADPPSLASPRHILIEPEMTVCIDNGIINLVAVSPPNATPVKNCCACTLDDEREGDGRGQPRIVGGPEEARGNFQPMAKSEITCGPIRPSVNLNLNSRGHDHSRASISRVAALMKLLEHLDQRSVSTTNPSARTVRTSHKIDPGNRRCQHNSCVPSVFSR